MALKTKVKVGNINSLSSARYCAGMGVDFLGFSIGNAGLNPVEYKEIIEWVSGPQYVLEAHRDNTLSLEEIANNYPGHYIEIGKHQIHWLENIQYEFILYLERTDWPLVAAVMKTQANLKYIELAPGSLDELNIPPDYPVILLLQDPAWLEAALRLPITGVALMSGNEDGPGLMNYSGVAEVLELLEEE
jgi:phosphoribosylanthranilate isomerase